MDVMPKFVFGFLIHRRGKTESFKGSVAVCLFIGNIVHFEHGIDHFFRIVKPAHFIRLKPDLTGERDKRTQRGLIKQIVFVAIVAEISDHAAERVRRERRANSDIRRDLPKLLFKEAPLLDCPYNHHMAVTNLTDVLKKHLGHTLGLASLPFSLVLVEVAGVKDRAYFINQDYGVVGSVKYILNTAQRLYIRMLRKIGKLQIGENRYIFIAAAEIIHMANRRAGLSLSELADIDMKSPFMKALILMFLEVLVYVLDKQYKEMRKDL